MQQAIQKLHILNLWNFRIRSFRIGWWIPWAINELIRSIFKKYFCPIRVFFFFNWQLLAKKLVKIIFVLWSDEPITNHHDHKDRILLTLAQKSWTKTVLSLLPLTILRAFCWIQTIWLLCEGTAWYFLILTQPGTGVAGLAISISQKCR